MSSGRIVVLLVPPRPSIDPQCAPGQPDAAVRRYTRCARRVHVQPLAQYLLKQFDSGLHVVVGAIEADVYDAHLGLLSEWVVLVGAWHRRSLRQIAVGAVDQRRAVFLRLFLGLFK